MELVRNMFLHGNRYRSRTGKVVIKMASRELLHASKLNDFEKWIEEQ